MLDLAEDRNLVRICLKQETYVLGAQEYGTPLQWMLLQHKICYLKWILPFQSSFMGEEYVECSCTQFLKMLKNCDAHATSIITGLAHSPRAISSDQAYVKHRIWTCMRWKLRDLWVRMTQARIKAYGWCYLLVAESIVAPGWRAIFTMRAILIDHTSHKGLFASQEKRQPWSQVSRCCPAHLTFLFLLTDSVCT